MRLAINRYAAMLVGWIPDVSEIPARRLVLIGVGASFFLHAVFFILMVLLGGFFSKADIDTSAPRKEIELTIVPREEPPPEPVLPLAQPPQRHFLDPTGLDISKLAPEKPDFESAENGVAASEQPGKGDIPLPTQEGRNTPYMAFKSQRALFGRAPQPFSGEPAPNFLNNPPPEPNPATAEQDVDLKPAPAPEKPEEQSAPATPAPAATPPPKSLEKTDTPALAQATPPPLKVVEKTKEDEIAVSAKPAATPPPSTAQTEQPQPKPVPTPVRPIPVATPKFAARQAMLATPAPRAQPAAQPSTQLEQQQNHIEGSISNRGRKSANMVATPMGKYRKQVIDAIGSRWQYYVKTHSDVIALGSAQVSFLVDSGGHVRAVRVESNTSNQSFADLCERAIREAEIPEPPAEVIAPMRDGHLEYSINFTLYSL